jgi:hypothetical protein
MKRKESQKFLKKKKRRTYFLKENGPSEERQGIVLTS